MDIWSLAVLYFGVSVTDEWQSITQLLSVFTIGMSHLFLTRWIEMFKQKFYDKMNGNQLHNYCLYLQLECNVCLSLDGVKCLNKKFSTSKQNQVRRSKAVLWKQTPDFKDTCDTYAHYAGHAVNVVSVENFDHFLNSLSEPSQKDSQLLEVLFL